MANPLKGEVAFTVKLDGEAMASPNLSPFNGKAFTLRYSSDALVQVEDALDRGIVDIGAEMLSWQADPKRIRFGFVRAVFWGGLREHHPEITLQSAGDLAFAVGGIMAVVPLITDALGHAFPKAETKGARPPNGRPAKKARAGTG